jgi:hypothetical protein
MEQFAQKNCGVQLSTLQPFWPRLFAGGLLVIILAENFASCRIDEMESAARGTKDRLISVIRRTLF